MANVKTILLVGGSGFIGTHLALRLREKHRVISTFYRNPVRLEDVSSHHLDLANRNSVRRMVSAMQPDVVIFACGKENLEWAEGDHRAAELLHTSGPASVMNMSEILQPKTIYLSNSYCFDGSRGNYKESDTVLPHYSLGKYKVGGENFVRGKSLNHVIIRSSPLIGYGNGTNLSWLDKIRNALERKEKFELDDNSYHSFASIHGLTELIELVIESGLKNKTFHYSGLTKVSYFEFATAFAKRFGYDEGMIKAKSRSSHVSASDVQDYSLNSTLAVQSLKIEPLLLEKSFDLFEKHLIARA